MANNCYRLVKLYKIRAFCSDIFPKIFSTRNLKNSIKIYSKISIENHEFRVLFLEIYHLSIIRNAPYLKAENYIPNQKKITKKLKFQWKFLLVKRKFFKNFAPEPRKIGIFKYFILTFF